MVVAKKSVRIVEVSPRDGLQNIPDSVPTSTKLALIHRLKNAGLKTIELTSIVSPRAVPQLSDCKEVLQNPSIQSLIRNGDLKLPVLVPNTQGFEVARRYGVKEIAVIVSASEGFSKANIRCSVDEGLCRATEVTAKAKKCGMMVRGYISCIIADPFDGPTAMISVLRCTQNLLDAGCYEVSLGDTIGVGVAAKVAELLHYFRDHGIQMHQLAGHFHDTYGQALLNVWAAYQCGIRVFDSSVAGLGGCPFALGARGNVATEDLVYMFEQSGLDTNVDLKKLAATGGWISQQLSQSNASRAGAALTAGNSKKRFSTPKRPSMEWKLHNSPESEVLVYRAGTDLKLVLNRPKNGNALTSGMINAIVSQFEEAAKDNDIFRIIITANGRFFCTGMDLSKGTSSVGADQETQRDEQFERLTRLLRVIDTAPQTTIACINGPAIGGGVGLAFACDVRIAESKAIFRLSEVTLGLCPATISKYVVREWGPAISRQAMVTGRVVTANELHTKGIISRLAYGASGVSTTLDHLLLDLRSCAPGAAKMCKELVDVAWRVPGGQEQEETIKRLFDEMMEPNSEGAHGVQAFQDGRKRIDWTSRRRSSKI